MSEHGTMPDRAADGSAFVGRVRELAKARYLLPGTRLLTLTGVGGVGKTRLALQVASTLRTRFPAGVRIVDLAMVRDGRLLETTVAAALGLRDTGRRSLPALVDHLADKRLLLVLDNCEHLLQECAELAARLLSGAPRLRILTTSRQALGVAGEQVLVVPPLTVPPAGTAVQEILRSDAVALFAERAARARPGFTVDAATAPEVAGLCRRLDGLPLAIELAAARLRTMPLRELAGELDRRFDLLASPDTALLPRHRTLYATIDWSFGLCTPGEQRLWARLAVFPGGADLEDTEAVCSGNGLEPEDILDLISGLVDKSVLISVRGDGRSRYRMLESIRAYGRERLAPGDAPALHRRYRDHYRRLAEQNRIDLLVPDEFDRYRATLAEIPNLRLALDLCLRHDAPSALRIAICLWAAWLLSGAINEGRDWLERSIELARPAAGDRAMGLWVNVLLAAYQNDLDAARRRADECGAAAEDCGDEAAFAFCLQARGVVALAEGDTGRGFALLEDARTRHRARDDLDAVAVNLHYAASFGVAAHSPGQAAALGEELLALAEAHRAHIFEAYALITLGYAAWWQGDLALTGARMRQAATLLTEISDRWGLIQCLEALAWTACAQGHHDRAARLLGAAGRLWRAFDIPPLGLQVFTRSHRDCDARARRELGGPVFDAAYDSGARLSLDAAVSYAISN
ncbi:ATP-binding protein [Actinomadura welshii]|uniref:ATP-binding protein n=1 Tax=Actinomadura welshii TaxID=3103817 RepID=UPI0004284C3B|nr:NB-ARC domain-containing protein [Actinomadura madurae]